MVLDCHSNYCNNCCSNRSVVIVDNNWRTFISESDITSYSYDQSGEGVNIVGDSNGVDTNGATREDKKN